MKCNRFQTAFCRRDLLRTAACGFGQIGLAALANQSQASPIPASEGFQQLSHTVGGAKRVIFLFMWGGPSHVDTFDYKPLLKDFHGRTATAEALRGRQPPGGTILGSPFKFKQHGEGGIWISELFPHLAKHADQMCVLRSLHTDGSAHGEALLTLHTGKSNLVRPSVGAWVSYGLGAESQNLPAFITISPPRGHGGVQNYGSGFLPAAHQATAIGAAEIPVANAKISNLSNPVLNQSTQRSQLELIQSLNRSHLRTASVDPGIEGLISSYELAFRMQSEVPQIMGLDGETKETLELYGIGTVPTDNFGRQCLLARKFAEQGVRYIQVSTDYTWDHHTKNNELLPKECARVDQPITALLTDLDRRGMLEDTLVIWGSEFGRTPTAENQDGRNHHPAAFSMWMAGGGVKGGYTYGATDDLGFQPVDKPMHMHDFHATLLHGLGLDHKRLTYRHAGRDFRLTDIFGNPATEIFS
ncbi:MAG: DUF1501 domain-containing protein [Planctomyces sp.]|nr:DUF1501 domain-containing protein [Planctomyces sp.]